MTHLIDSDVAIDAIRNLPAALDALNVVSESGLKISIISLGELYDGVMRQTDPLHRRLAIDVFLEPFEVINLDLAVMLKFASLRVRLRQTGLLIPDMDMLIAATAIEQDLVLLTRNRKHFQRIPGLRLASPEEVLTGCHRIP